MGWKINQVLQNACFLGKDKLSTTNLISTNTCTIFFTHKKGYDFKYWFGPNRPTHGYGYLCFILDGNHHQLTRTNPSASYVCQSNLPPSYDMENEIVLAGPLNGNLYPAIA